MAVLNKIAWRANTCQTARKKFLSGWILDPETYLVTIILKAAKGKRKMVKSANREFKEAKASGETERRINHWYKRLKKEPIEEATNMSREFLAKLSNRISAYFT